MLLKKAYMALSCLNTWPVRNKPRGQSAETTWSIGRNHDVFKLLALSPIALGFFASGLV